MRNLKTIVLLFFALQIFSFSFAQENLSMTSVDIAASYVPETIIQSAEQMPEKYYSFRPTKDVRTFGELVAHIAESNYEMAAIAKGETPPITKVNPTKKEAIEALKKSFKYNDEARKNLTEEQKNKLVQFMGQTQTARNVLDFSVFHSMQHYGNIIVYMRLKGLVPPSSQSGSPGNSPSE